MRCLRASFRRLAQVFACFAVAACITYLSSERDHPTLRAPRRGPLPEGPINAASRQQRAHVNLHHVVFTTLKPAATNNSASRDVRVTIQEQMVCNWLGLANVTFVQMHPGHDGVNESFGLPTLPSMFLRAQQLHPHAATFSYVNSDCISNGSFVRTASALFMRGQPFVAVGRRTNVDWSSVQDLASLPCNYSSQKFDQILQSGELGPFGAIDYLITSRDALAWRTIPQFVVGRVGFDTWLADHAYHLSVTEALEYIDCTTTVPMIHMTGLGGNAESHAATVNRDHNMALARHHDVAAHGDRTTFFLDHGTIYHAFLTTNFEWVSSSSSFDMAVVVHFNQSRHKESQELHQLHKDLEGNAAVAKATMATIERFGRSVTFVKAHPVVVLAGLAAALAMFLCCMVQLVEGIGGLLAHSNFQMHSIQRNSDGTVVMSSEKLCNN